MDTEAIYETWRRNRSQVEPSPDFADRVMQSLDSRHVPSSLSHRGRPARRLLRIGVCAAAVLAAVLRVVELFSLFAASNLEN